MLRSLQRTDFELHSSSLPRRPAVAGYSAALHLESCHVLCLSYRSGLRPMYRTTMPFADFCGNVQKNRFFSSRVSTTCSRSPRGKFDRLQRTTAGFTDTRLDGYGLSLLIANSPASAGLVSDSCPSAHAFAPRFLQTRLATTPLRFANPSPPSGWIRDLHPQTVEHARHTMAVHGKDYGEKPPTSFPRTLEIDRTDSHIPPPRLRLLV